MPMRESMLTAGERLKGGRNKEQGDPRSQSRAVPT